MVEVPYLHLNSTYALNAMVTKTVSISNSIQLANPIGDMIENKGIHVYIIDPQPGVEIAVIGLNQVPYTADAYLGFPVDVLGTDYVVATYIGLSTSVPAQVSVVAVSDATHVTLTLPTNTGSRAAGVPYTITLQRGQTYIVTALDLTGTLVQSDKPVAVFGSVQCTDIPTTKVACDHIVEQIPPSTSFGTKFFILPFKLRTGGDIVRVVARTDGTVITRNGATVGTINAQKFQEFDIPSSVPTVITTSKPALVMHYMKSSSSDGVNADPAMEFIPPFNLYSSTFLISTPNNDIIVLDNWINVVIRNQDKTGLFLDDVLLPSSTTWVAFPNSEYVGTSLRVSVGSHKIAHASKIVNFVAYSYGYADYTSYAYTAGCRLGDIVNCQPSTTVAGDGIDNDCDSLIDEELNDGIDNDGDGRIDEDLAEYQQTVCCATNKDPSPVLFNVPADVNIACNEALPVAPTVTASFSCPATQTTVIPTVQTFSGSCPTTVRTWSVTNECGKTTTASQTITRGTNTAPVLSAPQASYTSPINTAVTFTVTCTDSDNGDTVTVSSDNSLPSDASLSAQSGSNPGSRDFSWSSASLQDRRVCFSCQDQIGGIAQKLCVAVSIIYKPVAICGNTLVEEGEQCDPPSACCNNSCQFVPAQTVCRAAVGECDEAEVCTGASGDCPADVLSPATKVCGEPIGFCDGRIPNTCTGTDAVCHGIPLVNLGTNFELAVYTSSWENYDVISFNNFIAGGGEVEGRMAVRNNLVLSGGFSVGRSIDTTSSGPDVYLPYTVIVGANATWVDGSVWPDGSGNPNPSQKEFMYVGGVFNGPQYLTDRVISYTQTPVTAVASLDAAKVFYTRLQDKLAAAPTNAQSRVQWGGIFIKCASVTDNIYYINIDAADLASATWWNLENCNFQSHYVLNVVGAGDVLLQGGDFPTITERVIFNIVGSNRLIRATTGIKGNILAPQNNMAQSNGVTRGLVIVNDITASVHAASPNCKHFDSVTITGKTITPIVITPKRAVDSSTKFQVASFGIFALNDVLTIGSEIVTLVDAQVDSNGKLWFVVSPALTQRYPTATAFTATITDPGAAARTPIAPPAPASSTGTPDQTSFEWPTSASSTNVVAVLLAVVMTVAALL